MPSALAVQKVNCAIHWVSHYLMHKSFGFSNTYPRVCDFSGRWRYPTIKKQGPVSVYCSKDDRTASYKLQHYVKSYIVLLVPKSVTALLAN